MCVCGGNICLSNTHIYIHAVCCCALELRDVRVWGEYLNFSPHLYIHAVCYCVLQLCDVRVCGEYSTF